jgi:hypothetical protein
MTPLEAMAKAIFLQEFEVTPENDGIWDRLTKNKPALLLKQVEEVKAGLMALAQVQLPEEVIAAGWIDKEDVTPDEIFSAMLRAIIDSQ